MSRLLPGLALVALLTAAGFALHGAVGLVSPLLAAIALGALLAVPARRHARALAPGAGFAARRLLRAGVALLGLGVSLGDLLGLGAGGLGLAAGVIAVTMALTLLLGRRLGVPRPLALLIATGSSICGASAIAAMEGVAAAREEDVAYSVAVVTLFGTVAMLAIPVAGPALGLTAVDTGRWAGASIHEIAQVAAAGSAISLAALKAGTLVKLARVALLAPTIALTGARTRVPGFVLAFLALAIARTVLPLPPAVLHAAAAASTALLAAALAGLGLGIDLRALRGAGLRPLALGLAAALVAAATGLGLTLAV